jgi:large subunit ribosomal protein L4
MKLKLFKTDGTEAGEHEVANFPELEEGKGTDALRQVILAVRANKRQGNASTKLRSEVAGSGKKIYRQKGLGVGRAGDKRAPQRRGGGIVFGPKPRSYSQKLNKKVKKLAFKRALIDQADSKNLIVIEDFSIDSPKTKLLNGIIAKIAPDSKKVLLVSDEHNNNTSLAGRNLSYARLSSTPDLGPVDIVQSDKIIFSVKGIDSLLEKLGNS